MFSLMHPGVIWGINRDMLTGRTGCGPGRGCIFQALGISYDQELDLLKQGPSFFSST